MNKVSILIPVLNEVKTLEKSIQDILDLGLKNYEVIIIDNGSRDGSQEIIKKYYNNKNFKIILRNKNLGYGASVKEFASVATGEYLFIQYADLEYNHKRLIDMLKIIEIKKLDAVFGSRLEKNLSLKEYINLIRFKKAYLATIIVSYMINKFYKYKFTDTIGMKLYKKKSFDKLNLIEDDVRFEFELLSTMCKAGYKIEEVFVEYSPRFTGKKIHFYHMIPVIYQLIVCKFFKKKLFK